MPYPHAAIGARLRAARERVGMTQADAAAACGIDPTTLIGYEQGRRNPRLKIDALARLYGARTDDILGMTDLIEPPASSDKGIGVVPMDDRLLEMLAQALRIAEKGTGAAQEAAAAARMLAEGSPPSKAQKESDG